MLQGVVVHPRAYVDQITGCVQGAWCHHLFLPCVRWVADIWILPGLCLARVCSTHTKVHERIKHHRVHLHSRHHVLVQAVGYGEVLHPLVLGGFAHLHHDEPVTQVSLHVVAQPLLVQIGTTKHHATLGHLVVPHSALIHDRGQHIFDKLPGLGDLIQADKRRARAFHTLVVFVVHTEALVRQLTRYTPAAVDVRNPH